jgi:hypothetical protein
MMKNLLSDPTTSFQETRLRTERDQNLPPSVIPGNGVLFFPIFSSIFPEPISSVEQSVR